MQVVSDFGEHVEHFPTTTLEIRDASCLPHPKKEICDALMLSIMSGEMNTEVDSKLKEAMRFALTEILPQYQEGVGSEAFFKLGVDLKCLPESVEESCTAIVSDKCRANAEQYEQMEPTVHQERARYWEFLKQLDEGSKKSKERQRSTTVNNGDLGTWLREWHSIADDGDVQAQVSLGELYWSGRGVEKDLAQAFMWFKVASSSEHPLSQTAAVRASEIEQRLSKDERSKAKALLRGWVPAKIHQTGERKMIRLSKIELGPVQREALTAEQRIRVQKFHDVLHGVYPFTFEELVEYYVRDTDPDSEIAIWERIAEAFRSYCELRTPTTAQKKAVYDLLFQRALGLGEADVLARVELRGLPEREAKDIIRTF